MERIEPDVRAALELAADRIAAYHEAQMPADVRVEQPGVSIRGMHAPWSGPLATSPGSGRLSLDRAHDRSTGAGGGR